MAWNSPVITGSHIVGGGWSGAGPQGRDGTDLPTMLRESGIGGWEARETGVFVFDPSGKPHKIPGRKAIVRSDDFAVLGEHSEGYSTLQYQEKLVDPLLPIFDTGAAVWTSGGIMDHGAVAWLTAAIPGAETRIGRNDVIKPYLTAFSSHNGTIPTVIKPTSLRPVCENTFALAYKEVGDIAIRVKHTASAEYRLKQASAALESAGYAFRRFSQDALRMFATRFSEADMRGLAETLAPSKEGEKVSTRTANIRDTLVSLFENGKGQSGEVRGTAWAAFNAVTEFVDHERGTRVSDDSVSETQARFASAWLGSGAAIKSQAFAYVMARAA